MVWSGSWPVGDAEPRRVDQGVLRVVFAAAAAASSWFVVASATGMVRQFGGQIAFLGAALPYATSAPSLIAWGLVLTAALAVAPAVRAGTAAPALRFGQRALLAGAACEVLASGLSLWVNGLRSQFGSALLHIGLILDLLRATDVLVCIALMTFACGAFAARTTTIDARDDDVDGATTTHESSALWRRALSVLAVSLCLGAIAQGYEVVGSLLPTQPSVRIQYVMIELMTAALWCGVAASLVIIGRALRQSPRLHQLAFANSVGVMGVSLLAVASVSQFVYFEVQDSWPTTSWIAGLAKLSTAAECGAWLALMVGFGLAALAATAQHGGLARRARVH
jgi:hypothetical protein